MEVMSIWRLVFIGVPEVLLGILIGLVLCRGSLKEMSKKVLVSKMAVSIIVILSIVYFSRQTFDGIVVHVCVTMFMYVITFKFLWEMNVRQSIFATCIKTYTVAVIEILTIPLYQSFVQWWKTEYFFEPSIAFSPAIRMPQIFILLFFIKFNFARSELLIQKWRNLSVYYKAAMVVIIGSLLLCNIANFNYIDAIVKTNIHNINIDIIGGNIQLFFWANIWFFLMVIGLMYYIFKFLEAQKMVDVPPKNLVLSVAKESSPEDIERYIDILKEISRQKGGRQHG